MELAELLREYESAVLAMNDAYAAYTEARRKYERLQNHLFGRLQNVGMSIQEAMGLARV